MAKTLLVQSIFPAYELDMKVCVQWILSVLILGSPSNIFIQNILPDRSIPENKNLIVPDNKSGRKIGVIERFIMFSFMAIGQFAAVGLTLTAKSIARYDKISKDPEFAEYYLLGTLISTLCVLITYIVVFGVIGT